MKHKSHRIHRALAAASIALALLTGCSPAGEAILQVGPQDENRPLTASGTIQAQEIGLASALGGRILTVNAERGQTVDAGDVLVQLDATQVLDELAKAEAAIAAAEAQLAVLEAGPRDAEVAAARAALALAQAQQDGADRARQNALAEADDPQSIAAQLIDAQTQADLAAQNAELARAELERQRILHDQTPEGSEEREIADLQLQATEKALAVAVADEATTQTAVAWLQRICNEPLALIAQAHAAEGSYEIARAGVAVAQAQLDDLLDGATLEELAVARQAVALAQAQARAIEANLAEFTLASPIDGVVLDQYLHAGELAAPAAPVLILSDLSEVTLVVYVPENRIGEVGLGQDVVAVVDSLPGREFAGRVSRIADQPEFTPRNVATQEERINTYYAVQIKLPNPDGALKPGMPADAMF